MTPLYVENRVLMVGYLSGSTTPGAELLNVLQLEPGSGSESKILYNIHTYTLTLGSQKYNKGKCGA